MIGSMNGIFSSGMSGYGSSRSTSGVQRLAESGAFDYKAAQKRLQKAMDTAQSDKTVSTLKKDTADFLDTYAKETKATKTSATEVSTQIARAVRDTSGKDGAPSTEAIDKTVASVQKMVDAYNQTQSTLAKNSKRGAGIETRANRLAQAFGSENAMKTVGITADKTGKLTFDGTKLREALSGTSAQRTLAKDTLSGSFGIATRLSEAADAGLKQNPSTLVRNDLQNIKALQTKQQDTLMEAAGMSGFSTYSKAGAYTMMNMGTVGMLMNMMA